MAESPSSRAFPSSLWAGIYTFPFQLHNVKVWMILTICGIMLAFIACGFAGMTVLIASIPPGQELFGPARMIYQGGRYIYGALFIFTVIMSVAPSMYFVVAIEDTAAGNDEVEWPNDVWYDFVGKFFFMVWVLGCCAALATVFWLLLALVVPISGILWWALTLLTAFMLFPIPLYSAMIAGSPFVLIHPLFLLRLFQKPLAGLALYVHSLVLLVPCLGLGLWMVVSLSWWVAPIVGVIWATCLLCYARALGRVGYVLAEERNRVVKKKKRKKHRVRREAAD